MRIFAYQMALSSRKFYIDLDHVLIIDVNRWIRTPPVPHPRENIMMDVHAWEVSLFMAFRQEPITLTGSKMVPAGENPGVLQVDELMAAWRGKA